MTTPGTASAEHLTAQIDALLPQTQCTRCGFPACRPYAEAIAGDAADINRCPPGGGAGIVKLARLLGRDVIPLDPAYGVEQPLAVAFIEEQHCIGCTLCIQACPVDAIVGAPRQMHTVITELCTGCELCVAPCPVDCIPMLPAPFDWNERRATDARQAFEARQRRLRRDKSDQDQRLAAKASANARPAEPDARPVPDATADAATLRKKAILAAAIERARQLRG